MTKTQISVGAVALLVIGFILGVLGLRQQYQAQPDSQVVGAGGPTVYADSHLVGDVFSGLADVKMLSQGVMVGPIATAGNTVKVGTGGTNYTVETKGTATYNPPSLADGVVATTTVTVVGALPGDGCGLTGFTSYGIIGGVTITCNATTSLALVTFDNESGVTQDMATGTLSVWTRR